MIVTIYEKRVDCNMLPVISRFSGVRRISSIDGELRFNVWRPCRSDFREYRIKDYFYYVIDNDPDVLEEA